MNMSIGQPKVEPEVILTFEGEKIIKETIGFEGSDCVAETAFIMEGLQAKQTSRKLKPEYANGNKKIKGERLKIR
jgi:hypothetical protein